MEEFMNKNKALPNEKKYKTLLKQILPQLGEDQNKIILAEVMLALKQEGLIGKNLTKNDSYLINLIKETILNSPDEMKKALTLANTLKK